MIETLKYFLDFEDFPIRKIEIFEPFGMDGSTFKLEQEGLFGRDVFVFNEDIDLEFTNGEFTKIANNGFQTKLDGSITNYLGHGLDYILDVFNTLGADANIRFIIQENGIDFNIGVLDLEFATTDRETYLRCKSIESSKRSRFKINKDITLDVSGDKDLDDNIVAKLTPISILLKSKETNLVSNWESTAPLDSGAVIPLNATFYGYFNTANNLVVSEIKDSYSNSVNNYYTTIEDNVAENNFKYLEAKTNLYNLKIKIFDFILFQKTQSLNSADGFIETNLLIRWGGSNFVNCPNQQSLFSYNIQEDEERTTNYNDSFIVPVLNQGQKLYIFVKTKFRNSSTIQIPSFEKTILVTTQLNNFKISMLAVSSSINSVIQGYRLIDVIKQTCRMNNGMAVLPSNWDLGQKYYDQIVCSGYGIRNITQIETKINNLVVKKDVPFYIKTEEALALIEEVGGGFQIIENAVDIDIYKNFYRNIECGVLEIIPSESFKYTINEDYRINKFEYEYENFEEDRQELQTIDAVHTKTEWLSPTKKAKGIKNISVSHIRDSFKIEKLRNLGIGTEEESTSLSEDDEKIVLDLVDIGDEINQKYTGLFTQLFDGNKLTILANGFAWNKIGLQLGQNFTISSGTNSGAYTIFELNKNTIILTGSPNFNGNSTITINYTLIGLIYKNRTNEGFTVLNGISNPKSYSNLKYSIKRNLENWLPFLATCGMRISGGNFKNTYWKSNQYLQTNFNNEGLIIDNKEIFIDEIKSKKVVTDMIFETTCYANFEIVFALIKAVQTNKGYIRCFDSKGKVKLGFVKSLNFLWSEGKLEITALEKYESETFIVNKLASKWFTINEIWVTIFDYSDRPLLEPKRFTEISINGVLFTDVDLFNQALILFLQ